MNPYDSDESSLDDASGTSTNVLLGYASKIPTEDAVSQLGGHPSWLSPKELPSASLATCKVCNSYMSLLLQLNGELPERFPGHDRRLYVWACRRPPCKRKEGSVRAFRASRISARREDTKSAPKANSAAVEPKPQQDVGAALFGAKATSMGSGNSNPFSMRTVQSQLGAGSNNPFSTAPAPLSELAAKPPQRPDPETESDISTLPQTFADKVRISSPSSSDTSSSQPSNQPLTAPWPTEADFPAPYPSYHLDAEYEYLYEQPTNGSSSTPSQYASLMDVDPSTSAPSKDDKDAYESPHDTTFQHFADRLAQNPEQVLRYDFSGTPLLYSKTDAVGKLFGSPHGEGSVSTTAAGMPSCANCRSPRVFELQLTPHAIAVLEEEMEAAVTLREGMEWGSVLLGVCSVDCVPASTAAGQVGFVEEWVGVQWEEVMKRGEATR